MRKYDLTKIDSHFHLMKTLYKTTLTSKDNDDDVYSEHVNHRLLIVAVRRGMVGRGADKRIHAQTANNEAML